MSGINSSFNDSESTDVMSPLSSYPSSVSERPVARVAPTPRAMSVAGSDQSEFDDENAVFINRQEYVSPEAERYWRRRIARMGGPELNGERLHDVIRGM